MADPQLQWADASELSNNSRGDLPPKLVLRLTDSVCDDLDIPQPKDRARVADQHNLVQKFIARFANVSAIDSGVPFRQVGGRGLYRIRIEHWRGLVWTDRSKGIVWLCRAVSLADHPNEDAAYDALAAMGEAIFPTEDEMEKATKIQVTADAVDAMYQAMQRAHELPESWQTAELTRLGSGERETIGRAYVEQIEEEEEVLSDRFLIAVTTPPADISLPDWLVLLQARVFTAQGSDVTPIGPNDLPPGPPLMLDREIALAQRAL